MYTVKSEMTFGIKALQRLHAPRIFPPPDQRCKAAIKAAGQYATVIPLNRGGKQPQK
jgi:hypothetical protein